MALSTVQARDLSRVAANYFVTITLRSGTIIYLSDTKENYPFEPLILGIDGLDDGVEFANPSLTNPSVTLSISNAPITVAGITFANFSHLQSASVGPMNGATVKIEKGNKDEAGSWTPFETVFVGAAEEPQEITVESLSLRLSSLAEYRSKRTRLKTLEETAFPLAHPDDYGRTLPLAIGQAIQPTQVVRSTWSAITTLVDPLDKAPVSNATINVTSTSDFPTSGSIYIDDERILYTGITATSFTGCSRGQFSTTVMPHAMGTAVVEYRATYLGMIADHEVANITRGVFADWEGRLLRVSGGSLVNSGGRSYVSLPRVVTVNAVAADSSDTTAVTTVQPNSSKQYKRVATNCPMTFSANATTNAAFAALSVPGGTFVKGRVALKYSYYIPRGYALTTPATLTVNGQVVVTINTDLSVNDISSGTVGTGSGGSVEFGTTQWGAGFPITAVCSASTQRPNDRVQFFIDEIHQEAEYTNAKDPQGGTAQYAATNMPRRIEAATLGQGASGSITVPAHGKTSPSNIYAEIDFSCSSTMSSPFSGFPMVTFTIGTTVVGIHWNRLVGATSYFDRAMRNGGKVTIRLASWPASIPFAISALPNNNAISRAYFTITKCTITANFTNESPIVEALKSGQAVSIPLAGSLIDRIYVSADGAKSAHILQGAVGSTITYPDQVIAWVLMQRMGFTAAQIDSATFSAARTWYTANSYSLQVFVDEQTDFSDLLERLAFNARSILQFINGVWFLNVIADAPPVTLPKGQFSSADLDGEGARFVWGNIPRDEIVTSITARYKKNRGPSSVRGFEEWQGAITRSVTVPNVETREEEIDLEFVRYPAMCTSVVNNLLLRRSTIRKVVEFPVLWDFMHLIPGDTITIFDDVGGVNHSRKFFVTNITRTAKERATIRAEEWWGQ